jgi:hypothetical protein
MHWLGWMLNSLLVLVFSNTLIILFFFIPLNEKAGAVVSFGDPTVWWLVLFLYGMASTTFCFFISTFFQGGETESVSPQLPKSSLQPILALTTASSTLWHHCRNCHMARHLLRSSCAAEFHVRPSLSRGENSFGTVPKHGSPLGGQSTPILRRERLASLPNFELEQVGKLACAAVVLTACS